MSSVESFSWQPLVAGVRRKTVAAGSRLMMMLVELDPESLVPTHSHPHEQVTHVLEGRLRLTISGIDYDLVPGQTMLIPSDAPHSAFAIERALVLDTFSPPRDDLLAIDRGEASQA